LAFKVILLYAKGIVTLPDGEMLAVGGGLIVISLVAITFEPSHPRAVTVTVAVPQKPACHLMVAVEFGTVVLVAVIVLPNPDMAQYMSFTPSAEKVVAEKVEVVTAPWQKRS
jgi:hypothetical protein